MKLHLGCGKRFIPGFVHVDMVDMPHIDHKRTIADLSLFADNSAELIYTCHSLEYFDRTEVVTVLREWRRVLKPGGIVRIAVPDFDRLIEVYRVSGRLDAILGPLFGRMEIQTPEGEKKIFHRTVYNYESLSQTLVGCGFGSVRRYRPEDTIHRDYDDFSQAYYPHMDKGNGILISLNVEAEKE